MNDNSRELYGGAPTSSAGPLDLDAIEAQLGMRPSQPDHYEVGGMLTVGQLRALIAECRALRAQLAAVSAKRVREFPG